jgi:formylglycine-generating enzyme
VTYTDNTHPATLSDFRLDTYEVTVGRFRAFVAGYPGNKPAGGTGKNPNNSSDPGWNATWNASLPADQAALVASIKCNGTTWTDNAGNNDNRPMNCIDWYQAFAFCIWDGGRLPTEAEWNYAAAGGSEQRVHPWSVPPTSTTIDISYADNVSPPQAVGSKSPKGDSGWGQADMMGNVWEWALDWYSTYADPCTNCADTTSATYRIFRGGGYVNGGSEPTMLVAARSGSGPTYLYNNVGGRCARSAP